LEYFRYDQAPILLGLSLSQIISLILIPIGVILLIKPGMIIRSGPNKA
jgi:prolipoprotein diacylglyceryltransferase